MKYFNKVFVLPIIVIGVIMAFSTCKEDETCEAVIKVKFQRDSTRAVPTSLVVVGKMVNNKGFRDSGYTSTTAEYIYEKDLEAILDVEVFLDTNYAVTKTVKDVHFYGSDVLRLRKGKTVNLTVYIDSLNIPD